MYIARQPIFNKSMHVYGYELLYRDNENANTFKNSSPGRATATVLGGLFELGINNISNNKKSFINFDYDFLFSESIELIDPEDLIIEIVENTAIDDKLIRRLKELRRKGYRIALDDFVEDYKTFPLLSISSIIKYDIIATPLDSIEVEVKYALRNKKILLAEKVETKKEYEQAKKMGFHLFQGYFFEKPSIIGKSNNKKSINISYIRIMSELNMPEPSYSKLANIIRTDVNLSYRLLYIIKQNKKETNDTIYTIKRSLVYMGFKKIERWINILVIQDLATNKPIELTHIALIRSHFGELLVKESELKLRSDEVYGMLLFSTLDAILDESMEKALETISITDDMKKALISGEGELYPILQLIHCYEKGEWNKVKTLSEQLNISEEKISENYMSALEHSKKIMRLTNY